MSCGCTGGSGQIRVARSGNTGPIVAKLTVISTKTVTPTPVQRTQRVVASGVKSARDVNKYRDQ